MARLFQTVKTKTDPTTGQRVPVTDRNGNPVHHDAWRFTFTSFDGKRVTKTGYTSRKETEKLAASLEREAREIRDGIRDMPKTSRKHATRPIADVMSEYASWGNTQGGRGGGLGARRMHEIRWHGLHGGAMQ